MISLAPLTKENWFAVAALQLAPEQSGLVAKNVYSIAESKFELHYQPRAVLADEQVVGFLMYCADVELPDPRLFWLFRLMIDARHQGKGYGRAAVRLAIEEIAAAGATRLRTMHRPENLVAAQLYESAGFQQVGVLDDGDLELEYEF